MNLFLANITAIIFAILAAYLAAQNVPGWGWFLFFAVVCIHTYKDEGDSEE